LNFFSYHTKILSRKVNLHLLLQVIHLEAATLSSIYLHHSNKSNGIMHFGVSTHAKKNPKTPNCHVISNCWKNTNSEHFWSDKNKSLLKQGLKGLKQKQMFVS